MNGPEPLTHPLRLARLPMRALQALVQDDLKLASAIAGVSLTSYFVDHRWLWDIRIPQIERDPAAAEWIARAAVHSNLVVGHVGFHGPPNDHGVVEVAYSVDPALRRRGYGRAMLRAALDWARQDGRVNIVRATVGPQNEASLATLAGFPFVLKGEQWDEDDGRELVYESVLDCSGNQPRPPGPLN